VVNAERFFDYVRQERIELLTKHIIQEETRLLRDSGKKIPGIKWTTTRHLTLKLP